MVGLGDEFFSLAKEFLWFCLLKFVTSPDGNL